MPLGRRVVWVGRLDRQKGFPVAVRAFQDLAAKLPDVLLVVAGDGRDRDAVDRLDPSTRSRVHMLGTVPHAELPGVLVAGDVFLAPALGQETFGYVLIEAMASGVPVVASRIPGYDEVVRDDIDGILVPPGDAEALSAAVQRVLCEPALAERLRDAGRDRAAEYAWDRIGPRVVAVYERVAGGSG
jgi:glycosyltransferase involved in cell wall biosynthesis